MFSYKQVLTNEHIQILVAPVLKERYFRDVLSVVVSFLDFNEMYQVKQVNKNCMDVVDLNEDFSKMNKFFWDKFKRSVRELKKENLEFIKVVFNSPIEKRGFLEEFYRCFVLNLIIIKKGSEQLRMVTINKIDEVLQSKNNMSKENCKRLKQIVHCLKPNPEIFVEKEKVRFLKMLL